MGQDTDGYRAREAHSDIDRLVEECRTLSPSGIDRIAQTHERASLGPLPHWVDL